MRVASVVMGVCLGVGVGVGARGLVWAQGAGAPAQKTAAPVAATLATPATPRGATGAVRVTEVEGITEYRLPNGLRVLLAPDPSKPTTTVNITYLVGSRHESYGETGMAHLLEHMLFKGTRRTGNLMQEIARRGMDFNATTFYDRTNYYETFASSEDKLRWALAMEADRMVNSRVAKADLDTEFSVVRNEMEDGENSPRRSLWQHMASTAYDWHNYGKSTIGARSDVENVRIESLQAFYRRYYQPDNAVLVVGGKFDPQKTLKLVEELFGPIAKPRRSLAPTYTQEPVQHGGREVTLRRAGDVQLSAALYHTVSAAHPDSAAVAALAEILAGSPNGRLHKRMVERGLAVSVEPWVFDLTESGYMLFMAQLDTKQSLTQAREVLIGTLEGVGGDPVTPEELKRAKASLLAAIEKTVNDPQALALRLSESIAQEDWRLFFLQRDWIEALSLADVQRVAQNLMRESNRTLGQFVPTSTPARRVVSAPPKLKELLRDYQGKGPVAMGENFDASPRNIEARTQRSRLPGGLSLALVPKKSRGEIVHGVLRLDVGDAQSLRGQAAVSGLTAGMLMRGTQRLNRADLAARLDQIKAEIQVSGAGPNVLVRWRTPRAHLNEVLLLVHEVLRQPTFPVAELELLQREALSALEAQRSNPEALAPQLAAVAQNPYPADDVRAAKSFDAQIAEMRSVSLAEVKAFHARFYGSSQGRLAMVGDFDAEPTRERIQSLLDGWTAPQGHARLVALPGVRKPGEQKLEVPDKPNAFYVGSLPLRLRDDAPDALAMWVVNEVLGGGTQSRLITRLREKDGISYWAGSRLSTSSFDEVGSLELMALHAPQNLTRLKQGVSEELARFVAQGVTAQELKDAKAAIIDGTQIALAQDAGLANRLVGQMQAGRTMQFTAEQLERLGKLRLDEVNAALRRHVDPQGLLQVYAGDFAGAGAKKP